uniref:Uncharacterized protein n=1 Tax=Quercus lobata TaxID=97700 RepID=A0A7N2R0K4_QUELO
MVVPNLSDQVAKGWLMKTVKNQKLLNHDNIATGIDFQLTIQELGGWLMPYRKAYEYFGEVQAVTEQKENVYPCITRWPSSNQMTLNPWSKVQVLAGFSCVTLRRRQKLFESPLGKYRFLGDHILVPITNNGNEEMEIAMIINILPQTKANAVVAIVEDKLKILASCNVEDTYNLKIEQKRRDQRRLSRVEFPLLFVCMVAITSAVLGYLLHPLTLYKASTLYD